MDDDQRPADFPGPLMRSEAQAKAQMALTDTSRLEHGEHGDKDNVIAL